jgi:hypothetical protein
MTTLSTFLSSGYQGAQGTTGALQAWTVKTANYTAINGDRLIANTTAGSFTITLPATPVTGAYVQITDGGNWLTNNLLINRNGSTIEGIADTLAVNIPQTTIELVYDGTTWHLTSTTGAAGTVSASTGLIYAIALGI